MKTISHNRHSYLLEKLFALLIISTILAGCRKDDANIEVNHVYLAESEFIATVNKSQILSVASLYQEVYDMISTKNLSDVTVYKLNYNTVNVAGEDIVASGVVIVPITDSPLPILSYQHGSLFNPTDAPSRYSTGIETRGLATILASAGYAVSVPDYLGYGESSDYLHPYEHAKTLGSASFDMLMAAKEFFKDNNIVLSDKLFLTGYSEGGNATMAMHKHIEEKSDIEVTMSAPASGAYNKTAFAKNILQRDEELNFLPRFMWVIDSYNWVYKLNRPWSDYVNEPYAGTLEAVNDPFKFGDTDISHNPQVLFTTSMSDGLLNETDTPFLNALADNDNFDWTPQYPVTLYYGTADDYVFPLNSETAYNALLANGATVTKVVYEGKDHSTAFMPYVLDMFKLFETMK